MSALANLKLTAERKPQQQSPAVQRRNKMSRRLWEQIELAKAQKNGQMFTTKRLKTIRDMNGNSKTVEISKIIRPWWFVAENGRLYVNVRYGAKLVELTKNKTAVEVDGGQDELIAVLELLKSAVEAGELDSQIEAASGALRAVFKK